MAKSTDHIDIRMPNNFPIKLNTPQWSSSYIDGSLIIIYLIKYALNSIVWDRELGTVRQGLLYTICYISEISNDTLWYGTEINSPVLRHWPVTNDKLDFEYGSFGFENSRNTNSLSLPNLPVFHTICLGNLFDELFSVSMRISTSVLAGLFEQSIHNDFDEGSINACKRSNLSLMRKVELRVNTILNKNPSPLFLWQFQIM